MPASGRLRPGTPTYPFRRYSPRWRRPGSATGCASPSRKRATRSSAALGKLSVRSATGGWLLRDRPPLLLRLQDDDPGRARFRRCTPPRAVACPGSRNPGDKHRLLDVALKVVGVGSVGTHCYVALIRGPAGGPLVLQVKEARLGAGALRRGCGRAPPGERVVTGQRIMQAFSDVPWLDRGHRSRAPSTTSASCTT